MMGSHNQDQMQTIVLNDDHVIGHRIPDPDELTSTSHSNYKSTMSSFDHPLSTTDPPLSPPESPSNYTHQNDEDSPPVFLQPPSPKSDFLKISVSDPKKESESNNSYVTYLITTSTDLPDYNGSKFTVRRRFRDIVTLSDRLTESYRGFFIPPRPDKSVVERQVMHKHEFVEQRRVALERYLRRLAAHPMIKKSDELRVFLQIDGRMSLPTSTDMASRMLDGAVKLPRQLMGVESRAGMMDDVVQPAKSGRDLMRMFKELKQTVVMDWGGAKAPVEEEDKGFLEKKEKLSQLELQLGF